MNYWIAAGIIGYALSVLIVFGLTCEMGFVNEDFEGFFNCILWPAFAAFLLFVLIVALPVFLGRAIGKRLSIFAAILLLASPLHALTTTTQRLVDRSTQTMIVEIRADGYTFPDRMAELRRRGAGMHYRVAADLANGGESIYEGVIPATGSFIIAPHSQWLRILVVNVDPTSATVPAVVTPTPTPTPAPTPVPTPTATPTPTPVPVWNLPVLRPDRVVVAFGTPLTDDKAIWGKWFATAIYANSIDVPTTISARVKLSANDPGSDWLRINEVSFSSRYFRQNVKDEWTDWKVIPNRKEFTVQWPKGEWCYVYQIEVKSGKP